MEDYVAEMLKLKKGCRFYISYGSDLIKGYVSCPK